jgi:selenocysteine lyase/cysteine desulfurase
LHLVGVLINDLLSCGYQLAASTAPEHRSGIVVAKVPGADVEALCKAMQQAGVIVTARGGGVRIAPHFYNTEAEVLAVSQVLERTISTA